MSSRCAPTRRAVLTSLGAALVLPVPALAFGDRTLLDIAELDLGPGTGTRPGAWERLLRDVEYYTSVEVRPRSMQIKPEDDELFEHPFLTLIGDREFRMPSERGLEQLERYLSYGGFLVCDDTNGSEASGFDRSVRQLASMLFPTRPLAPVPADHSMLRSFFLIDRPVGRIATHPYLQAVTVGNIAPLVYSRNDLSGALERGPDGRYPQACVPGGEGQRREAMKLAINLVMYCLTANYKRDQAHTAELLRERRIPR